jgi:hypothetical protein
MIDRIIGVPLLRTASRPGEGDPQTEGDGDESGDGDKPLKCRMQTEHDILLVGPAFAQPYGYGLPSPRGGHRLRAKGYYRRMGRRCDVDCSRSGDSKAPVSRGGMREREHGKNRIVRHRTNYPPRSVVWITVRALMRPIHSAPTENRRSICGRVARSATVDRDGRIAADFGAPHAPGCVRADEGAIRRSTPRLGTPCTGRRRGTPDTYG